MTGSGRGNHLGTELAVSQSRIERNGLKAGTRAPLFTLPDLEGNTVSLDDYQGTDVLLVFSDPKCGPCQALAPNLVLLAAKNPQLQVLLVSRGDLQENRAKAHANAFPFPVVLQDGWKLSKEYGMFATPIAFLISKRGVIAEPVAVGAEQILGLIPERQRTSIPRWKAIRRLAAAFVGGMFAVPLHAFAQGSCPSGQTVCNGTCVNMSTDPKNCGKCGNSCASGSCESGACAGCPSGQTACNDTCVNISTDPNNCGKCGNTCASGESCLSGACACSPTILSEGAPEVINSGTVAFAASVTTCDTSGNVCFYFGTAASSLSESVCKPVTSQTGPQSVWAPASGFSSKTTYYYQARLETTAGAASGTIQSFTTP
jgi:peroxiredoxin